MTDTRSTLAVMVSGGGRTLANLIEKIEACELNARVVLVIASRECLGAEIARRARIETLVKPGVIGADELGAMWRERGVEWVALAGYLLMVRVPTEFRGRVVNIHPALLPSFGGAGMFGRRVHEAVIEAGCRVSGYTVHLCDDRYDTGAILAQRCCEVHENDTPETLAARVFALECEAYPRVLNDLIAGRLGSSAYSRAGAPSPRPPSSSSLKPRV